MNFCSASISCWQLGTSININMNRIWAITKFYFSQSEQDSVWAFTKTIAPRACNKALHGSLQALVGWVGVGLGCTGWVVGVDSKDLIWCHSAESPVTRVWIHFLLNFFVMFVAAGQSFVPVGLELWSTTHQFCPPCDPHWIQIQIRIHWAQIHTTRHDSSIPPAVWSTGGR